MHISGKPDLDAELERLKKLEEEEEAEHMKSVSINLDDKMEDILKTLKQYPVKTRVSLTGTMIVARDIAH